MKCIIVDDEPKARSVLATLVESYCPELRIVASCENLAEARTAVLEKKPDLVFLDIQLPGTLGFDLIENINDRDFALVFTTAHDQYAVRAFEYNAQDYLLKPIYSERLIKAVQRVKKYNYAMQFGKKLAFKPFSLLNSNKKIPLPTEDGLELVNIDTILRFQGEGSYCSVILKEQKPLLISRNLKRMEELVKDYGFFRIHNSHLINLSHVKKILRIDGGFVVMSDGSRVEVSRRKITPFLEMLGAK